MLVLTRKPPQQLVIGDSIRITLLETRETEVVLGIEAPADYQIQSEEMIPAHAGRNSSACNTGKIHA
jgi:carbon storage regulator